jgi:virulence factor
MRIAIIGLGGIARKGYLPVLAGMADHEYFLNSRRETTVREIQAQYRIANGSADLDDVLRFQPEAAFVLTPTETHIEIGARLLQAGVDVFLEKPAAVHTPEIRELAKMADKLDRIVMVGFNRRFAPLHRRAHDLLAGHPVDYALFQKNRRGFFHKDLANQITDDNVHQIDLLRYYCGEANPLSTVYRMKDGYLADATATLSLASGGIAIISACIQAGRWQETYDLHSQDRSFHIDAFNSLTLTQAENDQTWQEPYTSSWQPTLNGRGFTAEIEYFLDCVTQHKQPETNLWDALKTHGLVEAIIAAGKEVK